MSDAARPMLSPTLPPAAAELLAEWLPRLADRWRAGTLADADYAAAYFLVWRIALHGPRFASRTSKADARPDPAAWLATLDQANADNLRAELVRWFGRYHFLAVMPHVPEAILGWLRDGWPLRLYTGIPAPMDVLKLQAAGSRPATVVGNWPRAGRPVLSKADGCDFLAHDLKHAWKFFHDPDLHRAQRRFFGLLLDATEAGTFEPYRADPAFAAQFDYLISDMNTHPVHSLRYLAAVLIECLVRRESGEARQMVSLAGERELADVLRDMSRRWNFPGAAEAALLRLIEGGFGEAEARQVEAALGA